MNKANHNYIGHVIAVFLLMIMFAANPVCSRAETACREENLDSAGEAVQMLHEDWEDSYFEEVLVREDSDKVEVDGEKEKFTETFSVTHSAMKKAVSSGENLSEFLEKQEEGTGNIYSLEETDKYNDIMTQCKSYVTESIASFTTGQLDPVADWDAYLANLESAGLSQWLELGQAYWDRSK